MVLVRENTEDLYAGLEHTVVPGVVESLKIITEKASTRIARFAFEYARKHGRKKIHAIHKANIMKLSDGLFLTSIRKVAAEYPEIEYKELIIDNACMQMVLNPQQFDMLLLTNLYGDIMSDLAAGLVGGLGVVPSGNIGEEVAHFRSGPRHGARHRRKRNRQSHRAADERHHDARAPRRGRGRAQDRERPAQRLPRGQIAHPRCGRHSAEQRRLVHKCRRSRARKLAESTEPCSIAACTGRAVSDSPTKRSVPRLLAPARW